MIPSYPGYNNNVVVEGKSYHIQTSVAGDPPRIVTAVFAGGAVIARGEVPLSETSSEKIISQIRGQHLRWVEMVRHQKVEKIKEEDR